MILQRLLNSRVTIRDSVLRQQRSHGRGKTIPGQFKYNPGSGDISGNKLKFVIQRKTVIHWWHFQYSSTGKTKN
jgi:hypothetical protein